MAQERIEKLQKIGFRFFAHWPARWEFMVNALEDFVKSRAREGRRPGFPSKLVHHYRGEQVKLGRWVDKQRTKYRQGVLSDDEVGLYRSLSSLFRLLTWCRSQLSMLVKAGLPLVSSLRPINQASSHETSPRRALVDRNTTDASEGMQTGSRHWQSVKPTPEIAKLPLAHTTKDQESRSCEGAARATPDQLQSGNKGFPSLTGRKHLTSVSSAPADQSFLQHGGTTRHRKRSSLAAFAENGTDTVGETSTKKGRQA